MLHLVMDLLLDSKVFFLECKALTSYHIIVDNYELTANIDIHDSESNTLVLILLIPINIQMIIAAHSLQHTIQVQEAMK